jgi:hypothetical protein
MPVPSWNHVYTARDLSGYSLREILIPMWEAVVARQRAVFFQETGFNYLTPVVPAVTHYAVSESLSTDGWINLQNAIIPLAQWFVRRYNADGTNYAWHGKPQLDSVIRQREPGGTETALPFPFPNGWEHHYPREIFQLSYSGVAGQRARFSARRSTALIGTHQSKWYQCPRTNPLFGTAVDTPLGEYENSGKFFDHDGSGWVLSADQQSDPDEVVEFSGVNYTQQWLPGHYFGWWNINDARNAINQLVRVPAYNRTNPRTDNVAAFETLSRRCEWISNAAEVTKRFGVGGDWPSVESDYDSVVRTNNDASETPETLALSIAGVAFPYQLTSARNRLVGYQDSSFPNPITNIYGYNARMSFIVRPEADIYDPWGETFSGQDIWHEFGSATTSDFTSKSQLGALHATHFTPPYPPDPIFPVERRTRGWSAKYAAIIFDYEVAGGFPGTLLS